MAKIGTIGGGTVVRRYGHEQMTAIGRLARPSRKREVQETKMGVEEEIGRLEFENAELKRAGA